MKQGFTLLEMLVVVVIVTILAVVSIPQYQVSVERSRTAEALYNGRVLVDSMNRALSLSPNDLPNTKQSLDVKIGGGQWENDHSYRTKDFRYDLSRGAYLVIDRVQGDNVIYSLFLFNRYWPSNENHRVCAWRSKLGQSVCAVLSTQGFAEQAYQMEDPIEVPEEP